MDDWKEMDDAKDDQETDLAETPEQGNQSRGASHLQSLISKSYSHLKPQTFMKPQLSIKKTNSVSLLNRVLLAQIDKQAEDWNGLQFIVVFENLLA